MNKKREPVGLIDSQDLPKLEIMQMGLDCTSGLQSSRGANNHPVTVASVFGKAWPLCNIPTSQERHCTQAHDAQRNDGGFGDCDELNIV